MTTEQIKSVVEAASHAVLSIHKAWADLVRLAPNWPKGHSVAYSAFQHAQALVHTLSHAKGDEGDEPKQCQTCGVYQEVPF